MESGVVRQKPRQYWVVVNFFFFAEIDVWDHQKFIKYSDAECKSSKKLTKSILSYFARFLQKATFWTTRTSVLFQATLVYFSFDFLFIYIKPPIVVRQIFDSNNSGKVFKSLIVHTVQQLVRRHRFELAKSLIFTQKTTTGSFLYIHVEQENSACCLKIFKTKKNQLNDVIPFYT